MIVVLAKVQDVVEAIEKKSIWRGETMLKKLPQCVFQCLSITFTTWLDFQLKGMRIHISRNPKTSQDTWRKGGLCSERPKGERTFFPEEDPKEYLFGRNLKEPLSLLEGE